MINKLLEKISGKWIFLSLTGLVYLLLAVFHFSGFLRVTVQFADIVWKILPVFVMVFVLMFLSNLLLDPKKILKWIGREAGVKGWLISIAGGILSSGPVYMWYPLLSDLKDKGMKDAFMAVFLYNRAVKIPLLPMMVFYFGLAFTVVLTFYMIMFSVINGLVIHRFLNPPEL